MESLKNKTALVTGSARRIGASISYRLANEGCNVIVHYRNSEKEALGLVKELRETGVKADSVYGDFEKAGTGGVDDFFESVLGISSKVDILINSASIFPKSTLSEMTLMDLNQNILVNSFAPFALSKLFYDNCVKNNNKGVIINFLDTKIKGYDFKHSPYILSKHMLSLLTNMTALDYAPLLRVNAVAPGLVLAPHGEDASYLDGLKDTVPLKSYGSADDVNEAVTFLLKSDFVTGQTIFVDGGAHIKNGA